MKKEIDEYITFEDFVTEAEMDLRLSSEENSCFSDSLLYYGRIDQMKEDDAMTCLRHIWLQSKTKSHSSLVFPDYKDDDTFYSDWKKSLKSLTDKEYCIIYVKF